MTGFDNQLVRQLDEAITLHIRPDSLPLAVRMVVAEESLPEKTKQPVLSSHFSGRLDCADICVETVQTGQAQVILPCYGDRVFGQTQDHKMAFTIPAGEEQRMIDGLEGTHKGGIRYPTPSFLKYKPEFPKHYYRLFEEWADS